MPDSTHKIIVALDFNSIYDADAFVNKVSPKLCRLKIGKELFCFAGPDYVKKLVNRGFDVFLDMKFHDIPNTVEAACRVASDLGVWMINVHCLGGRAMLSAAVRGAKQNGANTLLTGVTVLTSHDDASLKEIGMVNSVETIVGRFAAMAEEAELDGVVCSVNEVAKVRQVTSPRFQLVTPGIRPAGSERDDQVRCATPLDAVRMGANHLVIGRPITRAANPVEQLQLITDQIALGS